MTLKSSPEMLQRLIFLREAVRLIKPVVFPLSRPVWQATLLLWTDASNIPKLGVVLYVPDTRRWYYSSCLVPQWMSALLRRLQRKKTYICQYEVLAAVCAYLSFGDIMANRLVHHFIY